jgi:cobalt-zinc-cadmium efflux system protein
LAVHTHGGEGTSRRLTLALVLIAGFTLVEVIGGLISGSLALLADAGHMLSDVAALALALFAVRIARRPHDRQRTYGYHRTEVLAALTNGVGLLLIGVWVVVEAIDRLRHPQEVLGGTMMLVAAGGLVVNVAAFLVLHRRGEENINVRGAVLHVLGDTLGSVAAVVAGLLVWWRGWFWADPALSLLIALIIGFSALRLVRESGGILMEAVPRGLDLAEIEAALAEVDEVHEVHDTHAWTISSGIHAFSAHIRVRHDALARGPEIVRELEDILRSRFHLHHTTIQVEPVGFTPEAIPLPRSGDPG